MNITIKPYYRSVTINGEEVREIVTPFPDFLNHLASVSCEADDTTHAITRVEGVHRYVSHFIAREYYYEHLDAFIEWFYTEKQAQIDKATTDQENLMQTIEETVEPRFNTVEAQVQKQEVTNLFYNPNLKTMNLVKGSAATLSTLITEATMTQSGLMTSGDVASLRNLESQVNSLINQGIWRDTYATYAEMLTANPNMIVSNGSWNLGDFVYVQADEQYSPDDKPLTSYVVTTTGSGNNSYQLVFRRVEPTSGVALATNQSVGVVKGTENTKGKVYVETDGSMSVVGWDEVETTHAPNIMTLDEIETHNDGTNKYPDLFGTRVLVVDEEINAIAPSVPLFGVVESPLATVPPGFLDIHTDNGVLPGSILTDAYNELVNMQAKGEPNIISFTDYDAAVAAEGCCRKFGLDTVNGQFRVPYIPLGFWYSQTSVWGKSVIPPISDLDINTTTTMKEVFREVAPEDCFVTVLVYPSTGTSSAMLIARTVTNNGNTILDTKQVTATSATASDSHYTLTGFIQKGQEYWVSAKVISGSVSKVYRLPTLRPLNNHFIKVFGAITNVAALNVDQLITSLNQKLPTLTYDDDSWSRLNFGIMFNGNGTVVCSRNVLNFTKNSIGLYTISVAPVDATKAYVAFGNSTGNSASRAITVSVIQNSSAGTITVHCVDQTGTYVDPDTVKIAGYLENRVS